MVVTSCPSKLLVSHMGGGSGENTMDSAVQRRGVEFKVNTWLTGAASTLAVSDVVVDAKL